MPVFSIHGNHDDPSGQGNFSCMDLLHATGLVNYFGKCLSLEAVELSPLLMQKGATRLALYGLGAMRDERLHRCVVILLYNILFCQWCCTSEWKLHNCIRIMCAFMSFDVITIQFLPTALAWEVLQSPPSISLSVCLSVHLFPVCLWN